VKLRVARRGGRIAGKAAKGMRGQIAGKKARNFLTTRTPRSPLQRSPVTILLQAVASASCTASSWALTKMPSSAFGERSGGRPSLRTSLHGPALRFLGPSVYIGPIVVLVAVLLHDGAAHAGAD
jgi:hypothetical protein